MRLQSVDGDRSIFVFVSPIDRAKRSLHHLVYARTGYLWTLIFSVQQFEPLAVVFLLVCSSRWRLLLVRLLHFIPNFAKNVGPACGSFLSQLSVYTSSLLHGCCRLASNRGTGRNVSSVGCNPLWAVANSLPVHLSVLRVRACSCTLLRTFLVYGRLFTYKVDLQSKPYLYVLNCWFLFLLICGCRKFKISKGHWKT
jgi:hypothetical protein